MIRSAARGLYYATPRLRRDEAGGRQPGGLFYCTWLSFDSSSGLVARSRHIINLAVIFLFLLLRCVRVCVCMCAREPPFFYGVCPRIHMYRVRR